MPRALTAPRTLIGLGLILLAALAWWAGAPSRLLVWAQAAQRDYQDALAGALRALRGGQPGAIWALLGLCFGYGFLHAVGPGHGKAVLGSYGLASRAGMVRMLGLALVSSLAQSAVAVALVYGFVWAVEGARDRIEAFAGDILTPLSWGLVAGLGLWLAWRGARGLRKTAHHHHDHARTHDGHGHHGDGHGGHCACGHRHGPTLQEVQALTSWRETVALVLAIALRPCTGALFVLILTWRMGIGAAGIAGVFAMGLGTATVTATTAVAAVLARDGVLGSASGIGLPARMLHGLELAVGLLIAIAALLALRSAL